jgi:ABC-2 type transport system ATP-binding protein
MSDIIICTEKMGRDFKNITALDDLSLEVPAGIVFGFLGPNGAGKTTTIRLLLGLLEPTRGGAEVMGFDIRSDAAAVRAATGALLEHNGLYERLSAEDNLEYYGRIWRMPAAERAARIRELLTHFGLWDRRAESAGKWSRGMKQKLAVARTLLHRPRLVFLDEPTAGLDPVAAASLREDLASLAAREGVTVFLTTHNLDEAERLCRRVAVIRAGRLLAVGPVEELKARQAVPVTDFRGRGFEEALIQRILSLDSVADAGLEDDRLIVTWKTAADNAGVLRLLVERGAEIDEVVSRKPTFETAFLELVKDNETEETACSTI